MPINPMMVIYEMALRCHCFPRCEKIYTDTTILDIGVMKTVIYKMIHDAMSYIVIYVRTQIYINILKQST